MLWRTHYVTPSFARPTPEDGKVPALASYIQLGQLPASVVMIPEWLEPSKVELLQEEDTKAELSRLPHGTPKLPEETHRPERVSVPLVSMAPLYLVHLLMAATFLSPTNVWHMMHAKEDAMGIAERVIMFMQWLRETTIAPQQGINALTIMDIANATLE